MAPNPLRNPQFATTLAHGLALLNCFKVGDAILSNKDFAERTGLSKATVSRLTYTLAVLGFLRYDNSARKYRLGSAAVSVGYPFLQGLRIRELARPLMRELADVARGSVSLGIRDRSHMVYVETARGHESPAFRPDTGASLPMLASAMGRAWLGRAEPAQRALVLEQIRTRDPEQWDAYHAGLKARCARSASVASRWAKAISSLQSMRSPYRCAHRSIQKLSSSTAACRGCN